jgi:hypothetical protein
MNATLPGTGPAPIACPPADRGSAPHYVVSARRRGRMHRHQITQTTDLHEALRCRAHYADLLARVMPAAGWRVSVHRVEELV